jgi:Mrp family chromosome partitioning ATPase
MSRVYNAFTGTGRGLGNGAVDLAEESVWVNAEETPYVEIGGPGGPVFSAPPPFAARTMPEAKIEAKPEPKPEPRPEPARTFPRLVSPPAPAYLSVKFHDVAVRGDSKTSADGPDATLVAFHQPDHPVSQEYGSLRDAIAQQLPDLTSRVVLFNSVAAEAGTTTVLLNLAVTLAQDGKRRVLVVDANTARPAVAAKLALKQTSGLCEALGHQIPLPLALQPSPVAGVHVLAAGTATDATPAAFCRDFTRSLQHLRQWYDWVLVDAGVWGVMPERDSACSSADAVYLVVREADTESKDFLSTRGWVKELGGHLRGYVTTRV